MKKSDQNCQELPEKSVAQVKIASGDVKKGGYDWPRKDTGTQLCGEHVLLILRSFDSDDASILENSSPMLGRIVTLCKSLN